MKHCQKCNKEYENDEMKKCPECGNFLQDGPLPGKDFQLERGDWDMDMREAARVEKQWQADIIRGRFNSEGISSRQIPSEEGREFRLLPEEPPEDAMESIAVMVKEKDYDRAREIFNSMMKEGQARFQVCRKCNFVYGAELRSCPKCGTLAQSRSAEL